MTFEEVEKTCSYGVSVGKDDPRRGTSKCKGPKVEPSLLATKEHSGEECKGAQGLDRAYRSL